MREKAGISIINRRTLVVSAVAAAGLTPLIVYARTLGSPTLERSQQFQDEFARLTGDATPVEGKITVDLPELAENGNFVPITISVDSPMTEADHVRAIHILATANPVARIATFHLSPINGIARVQSRIRLAKTEDVVTLAELSSGSMLIATTLVKVTIGGCGI
jgi:sulfur-oxidizing protein SoxY